MFTMNVLTDTTGLPKLESSSYVFAWVYTAKREEVQFQPKFRVAQTRRGSSPKSDAWVVMAQNRF